MFEITSKFPFFRKKVNEIETRIEIDMSSISNRILEFKTMLNDRSITELDIVQKYIIHRTPFIFNEDYYYNLKKSIGDKYDVHYNDVKMVGSAKLGFSIAPNKLWKEFDDSSDIDMAIISKDIFESFWKQMHEFNLNINARSELEEKNFNKFKNYFFRGWIRPDLLPFNFAQKNDWFDFFKSISYKQFGQRKITGAIYKDFYFFESYHTSNLKTLRAGGKIL